MNAPRSIPRDRVRLALRIASLSLALVVLRNQPVPAACLVDGPTWVPLGEEFRLCGPSDSDADWSWEGSGLTSGTDGRCIDVLAVSTGVQSYKLAVTEHGVTSTCVFEVRIGGDAPEEPSCGVRGQSVVEVGERFTLCGPKGQDLYYTWTGSGVPRGSYSRCVGLQATAPGELKIVLTMEEGGESRRCEHVVRVHGEAASDCGIQGPTQVRKGEPFALCAPARAGFFYTWGGPEVPTGSYSRCLSLPGMAPGTYDYTLTLDGEGRSSTCHYLVEVLAPGENGSDGPSGMESGADRPIDDAETPDDDESAWREDAGPADVTVGVSSPRPPVFWERLFGAERDASDAETREALERITTCVDERQVGFSGEDGESGFVAILRSAAREPWQRARRELAVLFANVCAAELGIRDERGRGVGIDPSQPSACQAGGATTVLELIGIAERVLGTGGERDPDAVSAERLGRCLAAVNRGVGIAPGYGVDMASPEGATAGGSDARPGGRGTYRGDRAGSR